MTPELSTAERHRLRQALRHPAPPRLPPADEIIRRARRGPRRRVALGGAVALAAALLLWIPMRSNPLRDKGFVQDVGIVHLQAAAETPGGALRPLAHGAAIAPEEWVVFQAEVRGEGTLSLFEDGRPLSISDVQLRGQGRVMAYRPDDGAGIYRYVLRWCPASGDCVSDEMVLRWR